MKMNKVWMACLLKLDVWLCRRLRRAHQREARRRLESALAQQSVRMN